MTPFAQLRSWLHTNLHRSRFEQQMESELRFHIESYAADLMRSGVPEAEALRLAKIEFGGVESHKSGIRRSLGLRFWDELWIDLCYAARMLRKSPGFTAIAILSLALGIGANTIIFTLAKEVLLQELAVPHPNELRLLSWSPVEKARIRNIWGDMDHHSSGEMTTTSFSYPVFQQLRQQNHSLHDLFAFSLGYFDATIEGHAETAEGEFVSGNYYQQLQITPIIGRPILPSDDAAPGGGTVAVISNALWARRFGRSPDVIGKTVRLNLTPITIVGVNPPSFTGAFSPQKSPDFFLPFSLQPVLLPRGKLPLLADPETWWVQIMGRMKPGVTEESARASLDLALSQAFRATMPVSADSTMPRLSLTSGAHGLNHVSRNYDEPVYLLLALGGLVLLLACVNLANLMLARAAANQREMSVRLALGASRARILRQVLTESLLLSMLGGAAGLVLGYLGRNAIPHILFASWMDAPFAGHFDGRVFAFTATVSMLTGVLFGLGPAWQATRTNVSKELKDSAATATERRKGFAGKAIIAFQIALSLLLVISAGLFIRTLGNVSRTDTGFQPKNLLLFQIIPPRKSYPAPKDVALMRQLEERFSAVPGVDSVTLSAEPLISGIASTATFTPDDAEQKTEGKQVVFDNTVGESFFSTMRIPLMTGRSFNSGDTETSPKVAIINQALAKKFFANHSPIGRTFHEGRGEGDFEVVGICGDTKYYNLRSDPPPTFYLPYRQQRELAIGGMTFEIRTKGDPTSVVGALREVVQSVDKDLPMADV
ncbi:MAG: ABC transporter permease, partial [Acidobacteriaceae bacterium]